MALIDLNKNLKFYSKTLDYTVSKEEYKLLYNEEYDLLVTNPIPKEIGKYYESDDYISHTDNNKSFVDKIYNIVKNYTLKSKLKLINSFNTEEKKLLDIGAGTGDFLNVCKKNNWLINGVEPSENARKNAKEKGINLEKNINHIHGKYDIITMWHVLEHVINLDDYIVHLKKLLKKDGVLIIAVPNYKSYDANYYKEFWAAYDVPRHIWHFSKKSIKKIFDSVDLILDQIIPMKFDSYYVSLLSEKYKKRNMKLIRAFYIGFVSNLYARRKKEHSSHIYILKNCKNDFK